MKKRILSLIALLILGTILLTGCGCEHEWSDWAGTSTEGTWTRSCSKCQGTETALTKDLAKEYIVGTWYSHWIEYQLFSSDEVSPFPGVTVEFNRDGTFVLRYEEGNTERTGKWEYTPVDSATQAGDFTYILDGQLVFYSMQHRLAESSDDGRLIGWILTDSTGSATGDTVVFADRKPSDTTIDAN